MVEILRAFGGRRPLVRQRRKNSSSSGITELKKDKNNMLWNLVVNKYEKYHLSHLIMLVVLGLYSIIGATMFCAFERPHEISILEKKRQEISFRSEVARKQLLIELNSLKRKNSSRFTNTDLASLFDKYDEIMGYYSVKKKDNIEDHLKWTIWGGLYYAGTIYTTIGYGDITAQTVGGRLFTIFYAIFGIPLVITVLNNWGGGLFRLMNYLWQIHLAKLIKKLHYLYKKHRKHGLLSKKPLDDELEKLKSETASTTSDDIDASMVPLRLAIIVLVFWVLMSAMVFCLFEKWDFFTSMYFFFISLTTIGFGDVTPEHKVACMNFLLILIGLSVVSMSINIIQQHIQEIFTKIVLSIDNDFKKNIVENGRFKDRKQSGTGTGTGTITIANGNGKSSDMQIEEGRRQSLQEDHDAIKKYAKDMPPAEKFFLRFMSDHQKKMLNERFDERLRMRNRATQTEVRVSTSMVQTDPVKKDALKMSLAEVVQTNSEDDNNSNRSSSPSKKSRGSFCSRDHYIYKVSD